MKVTVRTERFENEHGRKPRGYGFWIFSDYNRTWSKGCFGTYTEAKGIAVEAAKNDGISTIYVEA